MMDEIHPSREMVEASRRLKDSAKRFHKADKALREEEHNAEEVAVAVHEYSQARQAHQDCIKECEVLGL
jgi:hypothetical protein